MSRPALVTLALAVLTLAAPDLARAEDAPLTVAFEGLKTPAGALMVALYDAEASFDRGGKPLRALAVPVTGAAATARFELPAGRYGIKVFHDVDGDGRMGTNPFGIPTEPFAFSNNARGMMGPPKWAEAAFAFGPGAGAQTITLD
ncbi:DUF2141 domain-containing protein [Phenylobacterium sp.]|uniref:DUF2141 domain-containing protein n=1 Tax=Phenylobacterium sp. TaxID=1871053 RepID=UPI0035B35769